MIYHNYSYYSFYCDSQLLSGHDFWLSMLILFSIQIPNLDKLEKWPQRHKAKLFAKIYLCVLVSWWRKCFVIPFS